MIMELRIILFRQVESLYQAADEIVDNIHV